MPVDSAGNRADIIMAAESIFSRMNLGRLYETYLCASARDTSIELRNTLELPQQAAFKARQQLRSRYRSDAARIDAAYDRLLAFYKIISPLQYAYFSTCSLEDRLEHLADIVHAGIYLFMPTDNPPEKEDIVRALQAEFPSVYGPVSYIGNSGQRVTTAYPVRIAPLYFMLLEKIADEWSSVASGRLQSIGVLSTLTRGEKYAMPYRATATKICSETEGRIFACYMGREAVAEIFDRNNNPTVNRAVVRSILTADKPTNIPRSVDRSIIPFGGAKPLQIMRHMTMVAGWVPKYVPEQTR